MSTHISGFEDVSKERMSKVWINMLFHKEKGLPFTVPIDRILSVKNVRAWVSMDFT